MWAGLGADADRGDTLHALLARHAEPWRRYHTLQHLAECVTAFDTAITHALRPAEVEAALWFHDAVYDPRRDDNEALSARLSQDVLVRAHVTTDVAARVATLVLATRHDAAVHAPDERLVVDIDLAILGASDSRFEEYEKQVREEYSFVPEADFRARRRAILRAFVERASIYNTRHFRDRLERRARENLTRALSRLGA